MEQSADTGAMRVLLVIGDSLSQARPWASIYLRDIYATRLQRRHAGQLVVVNFGTGSNNTARQLRAMDAQLSGAEAEFLVIQIGIVDCAPRLMSEIERLIIGGMSRVAVLRRFNAVYVAFKSRHRYQITKIFPKVQVPIDEFEINLRQIHEFARKENPLRRTLFVNIACPGASLMRKSFNILENVKSYNAVIAKICHEDHKASEVVDVFAYTRDNPQFVAADDGYHILPPVHEFIADRVSAAVQKCMEGEGAKPVLQ